MSSSVLPSLTVNHRFICVLVFLASVRSTMQHDRYAYMMLFACYCVRKFLVDCTFLVLVFVSDESVSTTMQSPQAGAALV